jgi:RNA polymerase sigma factor (sigma-70 family)
VAEHNLDFIFKCVKSTMKISETSDPAEVTHSSIEHVFAAEETPLLKFAFGYVKRREVAEEIVQDAFMKLHQQWGTVEKPRPWLYQAVRNIALNHIRKSKRETLTDEELSQSSGSGPDDQIARLEAVHAMQLLLDDLEENDRAIVRLKFDEEQSYSEISMRLEMGIGNVGYRLHHILKGLADGLRRKGIDRY